MASNRETVQNFHFNFLGWAVSEYLGSFLKIWMSDPSPPGRLVLQDEIRPRAPPTWFWAQCHGQGHQADNYKRAWSASCGVWRDGDNREPWKHIRRTPKPAQNASWKRCHLSCELKGKNKLGEWRAEGKVYQTQGSFTSEIDRVLLSHSHRPSLRMPCMRECLERYKPLSECKVLLFYGFRWREPKLIDGWGGWIFDRQGMSCTAQNVSEKQLQ